MEENQLCTVVTVAAPILVSLCLLSADRCDDGKGKGRVEGTVVTMWILGEKDLISVCDFGSMGWTEMPGRHREAAGHVSHPISLAGMGSIWLFKCCSSPGEFMACCSVVGCPSPNPFLSP